MKYIVTKYVITEPKYEIIKTTYEKCGDNGYWSEDNGKDADFDTFDRMFWNIVSESEYYKGFATCYCTVEPKESIEVLDNGKLLKFITTYTLGPDENEPEEPNYDDVRSGKNDDNEKPINLRNESLPINEVHLYGGFDLFDNKMTEKACDYIVEQTGFGNAMLIPGSFIRLNGVTYNSKNDTYEFEYAVYRDWKVVQNGMIMEVPLKTAQKEIINK